MLAFFAPCGAPAAAAKPLSRSGRPNLGEKLRHLPAKLLALCLQRLGGALDVVGRGRRRIGVAFHARDVLRNVLGALCRILRATGDLLRGGSLLLHGGGYVGGDLVDLADDATDAL